MYTQTSMSCNDVYQLSLAASQLHGKFTTLVEEFVPFNTPAELSSAADGY